MKEAFEQPHLPILRREGWDDFSMADADQDIAEILGVLESLARTPDEVERVMRLSEILGGLMAYASAMHRDLAFFHRMMN